MIKELIEDVKSLKPWLTQWLFYRRHALRLKLAIRLANMKQKAWNKQYFVILSAENKLISLNSDEIDSLRKTKVYPAKQMKKVAAKILQKQDEAVQKLTYELRHAGKSEERRELNAAIIDIKEANKKLILRLSRLTVLPKHIDGLTVRRTSFYYTAYGENNKMTQQQMLEARSRYITYAKKYLK